MKANELRLGNWVICYDPSSGKEVFNQIDILDLRLLCGELQSKIKIKPIPLTEEWLLKFGFEAEYENVYGNTQEFLQIEFTVKGYVKLADGYYHDSTPMLYVHQLQNLYFALTGEELTIKE